ncbi:GNAT family N-acetyltransferase [Streptomyces sp. NPDC050560]|uniref:GNAT family N-acetyltransferase n=1 Tax=Streptomyces sp. NPDC050560 TaxID=3365630 RepID=UPI0037A94D8F
MPAEPAAPLSGFAVKPVLTGAKAVLRPFTEADAEAMAAIIEDPEVTRFTGPAGVRFTLDRLRAWYGSRGARDDRLDLAVTDRVSGEVVGESVLFEWSEPDRSCLLRILLGPGGRDRGLGTETLRLTLAHAFGPLGLNRVALGVHADNPRAIRVYERVGFVREGVARQAVLKDGGAVDEIMMAVLAEEWRAHGGHPGRRPDGTATL